MNDLAAKATPVKLSNVSLTRLPKGVSGPRYDRLDLRPGIVHIGVGNFHRAHQAWYLHRLMQDGKALDWAILGAGVRAADAVMRQKLLEQDCLATLIELDPSGRTTEVCGAMIDFLPVEQDNASLIAAMSDPAIRIVSLTVTESGYFVDPSKGGFDPSHPDIQFDARHAEKPRTVFGAIVAALRLRQGSGAGPFTVQSCDNLRGNGAITRQAVVSLARLSDPALADWIDETCSFPNSMVDCIVPATGPAELALARDIGIDDKAPVTHENFRQWVIEDDFCAGRPDWDQAGAVFSDAVHDYETMKIRILNAGHQVLANIGELLGVETIADCMADPQLSTLFHKIQKEEVAPLVAPVPGMTSGAYVDLIATRFANPAIRDTTRRVAFDGSSRHPGFVLPIVREALIKERPIEGLALVEALWARMCAGIREDGSEIEANDPLWPQLTKVAAAARERPMAWLEQRAIYGDLAGEPQFTDTFCRWLGLIWSQGSAAALREYTQSSE